MQCGDSQVKMGRVNSFALVFFKHNCLLTLIIALWRVRQMRIWKQETPIVFTFQWNWTLLKKKTLLLWLVFSPLSTRWALTYFSACCTWGLNRWNPRKKQWKMMELKWSTISIFYEFALKDASELLRNLFEIARNGKSYPNNGNLDSRLTESLRIILYFVS
jgi:hypothetical protein